MNKIFNVVLNGGIGSRLWPLSKEDNPKQFLKIFKKKSLFQHTLLRNRSVVDDYLFVTNKDHLVITEQQSREIEFNISNFVVESVVKGTAPAVTLAALNLNGEDIMFVTPSDHIIDDEEEYKLAVKKAIELAERDYIAIFGITPLSPNTGYGYIESDGEDVKSFKEKPSEDLAKEYVNSKNFYWNSGMLCFKASIFLNEIKAYAPEIYKNSLDAHKNADNGFILKSDMEKIPKDSIDYTILEKSKIIKMVKSNFDWSDLGSFDSLIAYFQKLKDNQMLKKIEGEKIINSFAIASKPVYATSGIDDIVLVETEDCILLSVKGKTEKIRGLRHFIKMKDKESM